jgi:hypothetical protein
MVDSFKPSVRKRLRGPTVTRTLCPDIFHAFLNGFNNYITGYADPAPGGPTEGILAGEKPYKFFPGGQGGGFRIGSYPSPGG